jgi:hypothetical protein
MTTMTLEDLENYFGDYVPHEIGLKFPDANGKIARMIIDEEAKDGAFLPGSMPAALRAEFAVPTIGGFSVGDEDIKKEKAEVFKIFAQMLILKHRAIEHNDEKAFVELEKLEILVEESGIEFDERERKMLEVSAGFWGPSVALDKAC